MKTIRQNLEMFPHLGGAYQALPGVTEIKRNKKHITLTLSSQDHQVNAKELFNSIPSFPANDIIGKNKITEQKTSIFMDFWPASSDYRHVDQKTVLEDAKEIKLEQDGEEGNKPNNFGMTKGAR